MYGIRFWLRRRSTLRYGINDSQPTVQIDRLLFVCNAAIDRRRKRGGENLEIVERTSSTKSFKNRK